MSYLLMSHWTKEDTKPSHPCCERVQLKGMNREKGKKYCKMPYHTNSINIYFQEAQTLVQERHEHIFKNKVKKKSYRRVKLLKLTKKTLPFSLAWLNLNRFLPYYKLLISIFLEHVFRKLSIANAFSVPYRYKSSLSLLPVFPRIGKYFEM